VLVAAAELATPAVAEGLQAAGWAVESVTAYRTVTPEHPPEALDAVAGADAVLFTSASTVDRFLAVAGADLVPPLVVCIGPSTASRALARGLTVSAVADDQSDAGLVAALTRCRRPS
jgi:uroporphyrinogen-III synthase